MTISITHAFNSPVADGTTLYTGNITSGSAAITGVSPTPPSGTTAVGYKVYGTGIPTGTTILSVSGTTINLSANATATTTGLSFYTGDNQVQPSDWNAQHTLTLAAGKLLGRDTSGAGAVQELPIAVDTSGNVGIGTTSQTAISNYTSLTLNNTTGGIIDLKYGNTLGGRVTGSSAGMTIETGGAIPLTIYTNNAARMTVDSSGNVGIGTTSPSGALGIARGSGASAMIEVAGNGNTPGTTSMLFGQDGASSGYVWNRANNIVLFGTNNTERMRIDSSGNVGIGRTPSSSTTGGGGALQGYSFGISATAGFDTTSYVTNAYQTSSSGTTWNYVGTATATRYDQFGGSHRFYYAASGTAGSAITWSEAMRIDTSGNVGIGFSAPNFKFQVNGPIVTSPTNYSNSYITGLYSDASAIATLQLGNNGSNTIRAGSTTAGGYIDFYTNNTAGLTSATNGNFCARMDASGNFIVGATTQNNAQYNGGTFIGAGASPTVDIGHASGTPNGYSYIRFFYAGTQIGQIYQSSTSGVSYLGTSDYRLKENVTPMTNGLATIAALKPVNYIWKSDKSVGEGFIAHELQEVIPIAVGGEKDAVDEDGKIIPQGIDMSRIVPHLVAAIQELTAKVTALEAKIGA